MCENCIHVSDKWVHLGLYQIIWQRFRIFVGTLLEVQKNENFNE
jgi:hypothetical protein